MQALDYSLQVMIDQKLVGELRFDPKLDILNFTYAQNWCENGFAISPHLPLSGDIPSIAIKRFLENLFPEGECLELLLDQFRISTSNVFGIIKLMGSETTGALRFLPANDEGKQKTFFREVSESELIERLDNRGIHNLMVWDSKPRLSVAGIQDKLPVTIFSDGRMGFGEGKLASTHILKFQKENTVFPHLVLNEYCCMQLAIKMGLSVAETAYKRLDKHPVLFVKRFDRQLISDKKVARRHIIDGCQALNLPQTYKYERPLGSGRDVAGIRDGASLPKLFQFCEQCLVPAADRLKLLNWMLFNLCISNADAHGKNISYIVGNKGIYISPFYDLLNTSMYSTVEQELAMAIGDEFNINEIYAYQLVAFAEESDIPRRLLFNQLKTMLEKIPMALEDVINNLPLLEKEEKSFVREFKDNIILKIQHFDKYLKDIMSMTL